MRMTRTLLLAALAVGAAHAALGPFDASKWTLPANFKVDLYGHDPVANARSLAISGNSKPRGPVITFVGAMTFGGATMQDITAIVDTYGRGSYDYKWPVVKALSAMPNGVAWYGGDLYIASLSPYSSCKLYKLPNADSWALNKQTATLADLVLIREDLPFDFWHGWKFIRFGPDGRLYVPIGANCNICKLDGTPANNGYVNGSLIYNYANSGNPYHVTAPFQATPASPVFEFGSIYSMLPDGSDVRLYAKGVRNTVGFDWHPTLKQLYFTDNGRDDIGGANANYTDNHPDCELNRATAAGQHFGFPYCHTGPSSNNFDLNPYLRPAGVGTGLPDPQINPTQAGMKCSGVSPLPYTPAIQAMGPHTAPLGMRFYKWFTGSNFPSTMNNAILLAQHGSWNRQRPIGARVMKVTLSSTGTSTSFTPFLSGGVPGDTGLATGPVPANQADINYVGRPVDLEQLPDGSVLVSDDYASRVYRIRYDNPALMCRAGNGKGNGGNFASSGAAVPGSVAAGGCLINLGGYGVQAYRRCFQWDTTEKGNMVYYAYNVRRAAGNAAQVILDGVQIVPRYTCTNANGWMAAGLPKSQGEDGMLSSNVVFAFPTPGTMRGAASVDFKLMGWTPDNFTASQPGFLAGQPVAYYSADALVNTFSINLPAAFGGATTPKQLKIIMALGELNATTGAFVKHWVAHSTLVGFSKADIDVQTSPVQGMPVLNVGLGPRGPVNGVAPPPPPAPLPPEDPAPACGAAPGDNPACCLDGVQYATCLTSAAPGVTYTQYYRWATGRLYVGIRGTTTSNWLGWAYNPGWQGHMVGADAFFARPCPTCPTSVSSVAFSMPSTAVGTFGPPSLQFTPINSGVLGGDTWASFWLPVPDGQTIKINTGTGPYTGTAPAAASGMLVHPIIPPTACVTLNGAATSVALTGC